MAIKNVVKKNLESQEKLKKQAQENTTVSVKKGRDNPVPTKSGTPLDHTVKHQVKDNHGSFTKMVGINKGITKNMDNFESLRIDCWVTDSVNEGETHSEALDRISSIVDERIQLELSEYTE